MSEFTLDSMVIVHKDGKLGRAIGRVVQISDPIIAKRTDAIAVHLLTGERAYTKVVVYKAWVTDGGRVCYLCKNKEPMNDRDNVRCRTNGIIQSHHTCDLFQNMKG
jgi:hypothetical protein